MDGVWLCLITLHPEFVQDTTSQKLFGWKPISKNTEFHLCARFYTYTFIMLCFMLPCQLKSCTHGFQWCMSDTTVHSQHWV